MDNGVFHAAASEEAVEGSRAKTCGRGGSGTSAKCQSRRTPCCMEMGWAYFFPLHIAHGAGRRGLQAVIFLSVCGVFVKEHGIKPGQSAPHKRRHSGGSSLTIAEDGRPARSTKRGLCWSGAMVTICCTHRMYVHLWVLALFPIHGQGEEGCPSPSQVGRPCMKQLPAFSASKRGCVGSPAGCGPVAPGGGLPHAHDHRPFHLLCGALKEADDPLNASGRREKRMVQAVALRWDT